MILLCVSQVGRETEIDCALAELYVRGLAVERLVKDQHQAEIFNSIYTRMNEVLCNCTIHSIGSLHSLSPHPCLLHVTTS